MMSLMVEAALILLLAVMVMTCLMRAGLMEGSNFLMVKAAMIPIFTGRRAAGFILA